MIIFIKDYHTFSQFIRLLNAWTNAWINKISDPKSKWSSWEMDYKPVEYKVQYALGLHWCHTFESQ